jgi:hypothetical protein
MQRANVPQYCKIEMTQGRARYDDGARKTDPSLEPLLEPERDGGESERG